MHTSTVLFAKQTDFSTCPLLQLLDRIWCVKLKAQTDILLPPPPGGAVANRLVSILFHRFGVIRWRCHRPRVCLVLVRLPLPRQGSITCLTCWGVDRPSCRGHKWWKQIWTLTTALAPSLVACFVRSLIRNSGLPLCRWLRQDFALGCQVDVRRKGLLEALKSLINQAQGMPRGSLPGGRQLEAFVQPGCLPRWGSDEIPGWKLRKGGSRSWFLTCRWYSG